MNFPLNHSSPKTSLDLTSSGDGPRRFIKYERNYVEEGRGGASLGSPSTPKNTSTEFRFHLHSAGDSGLECSEDAASEAITDQVPLSVEKKAHFLIGTPESKNGSLKRTRGSSNDENLLLSPELSPKTHSSVVSSDSSRLIRESTMTIGKVTEPPSSSTPSIDVNHNSRRHPSPIFCKSKEENFECLADGTESFFDSANENTSLQFSREGNESLTGNSSGSLPFRRNSLLRSSLRKSPQNTNGDMGLHRRVGSFRNPSGTKRSPVIPAVSGSSALAATQLYRSSSFNSSGRSSAGDVEEMYSDGSLEDEVIDLTQKYHHLEEKFTVLAENQSNVDDRYARSKQENIELSTKLFMLEEQMRDAEQRADERLREEQRRSKEAYSRLEREKELQIANYEIRLQALQKELDAAKTDGIRMKGQYEKERSERAHLSEKLLETERELCLLRDGNRKLIEDARSDRDALTLESIGSQQALLDLKREFENLRKLQIGNSNMSVSLHQNVDGDLNELYARLTELEETNKRLKNENRELREGNEDLTAQILSHGLEEGRQLLSMNQNGLGNSLAAEFEAMSQEQQSIKDGKAAAAVLQGNAFEQMRSALKEQTEVNDQLKAYIDNILLSIVENYPQLLEVKNKRPEFEVEP